MPMRGMQRREFLKQSAAAVSASLASVALEAAAAESTGVKLPKAVQVGMLPQDLSDEEKFTLAKACGFVGLESGPLENPEAAKELGDLARTTGVPIHSICFGGWQALFSDPDPAVVDKGLRGMENALRCAKAVGADAVLLVPARVTKDVRYVEAYDRSQQNIRKLLPLAQELGVVIAVENVWNDFLLSPLEFARYVDEFESPWLRAYFDIGNVVAFGWSQDWIRTLGKRIVKIHLKDFKRDGRAWTPLGEGDVNWPEVRRALVDEVGYRGFVTPELPGGDEAYLRALAARIDQLIAGT